MKPLTITATRIYKLNVPLKEPFVISLGPITDANNIVVKIETDAGLVGTGECSPFTTIVGETQASEFEMAKTMAALLQGKSATAIEDRLAELDAAIPRNSTIKSAFDMALYDLLAKSAGLPLYRLLGGGNGRRIYTDMTVGIDSPERMASAALGFKDAGFPAIKVKLGTSASEDVERIRAIRAAVGDQIPLRIDANQGWDPVTAIQVLKALEPFGIDHCEEPVPHWDNKGLTRVTANSPIPIMADESVFDHRDAFRLACMGACDYFNIKLSKSGGIHNALKIVAVAEAAGIKSQVGCMSETRYGLTALTHLVAARENIVHYDIDSSLMHVSDPVTGGIEYAGGGEWLLPETPGIGADFDPGVLDASESAVV